MLSTILLVLFAAGLAGGLVALFLKKQAGKTSWLCLGGTFAGGAFLASAIFELIPEAVCDLGWLKTLLVGGGLLLGLRWLDRRAHHAHAEIHGHHPHGGSASSSLVLGGMLGLHSVLEGLALGSIQSGPVQQALAVAILMHKATDTFALAITMGRKGASHGSMIGVTILLSLATPAGAWLASQADLSGAHLLHGTLSAATAGTFLYLAYSDLLVPELKEKEGRFWKIAAAVAGFVLLAAVASRHAH
jgi:zinc and cadmium transporter